VLIPVRDEDIRQVRSVTISTMNGQTFTTWVHHTAELSRRSESSRQARFRSAMASLETDDPDLPNLINIVEKVIFDEQHVVDTKTVKHTDGRNSEKEQSEKNVKLSISLDEIKKKKSRRRIVNSGDLGLIMDALIHNLGIGLQNKKVGAYSLGRDEEDMIATDDEETPDLTGIIGGSEIVSMCHRKVRNMVTRMLKQFSRVQNRSDKFYIPIVQLVAVMALIRQLRKFENGNAMIPIKTTLVPQKERERLLDGVLPFLYGKNTSFVSRAEKELIDEPIDEISRLKGLMLWLAKDCGADIRAKKKKRLGVDYDRMRRESFARAKMLVITQIASNDDFAFLEAEKSIKQTTEDIAEATSWLRIHKSWGYKFYASIQKLKEGKKGKVGRPNIGDLVYLGMPEYDFFNVVYTASNFSDEVKMVGVEGDDELIIRSKSKLSFFRIHQ